MINTKHFISTGLAIIAAAALISNHAFADEMGAKSKNLKTLLAEQNLEMGELVEFVPEFRVNGWTYVEPRHMTVVGAESRRYLVSLQKCYGLGLPRAFLIPRLSKSDRLARYDTFLVKNNGMTVAHCDVKDVYELNPLE